MQHHSAFSSPPCWLNAEGGQHVPGPLCIGLWIGEGLLVYFPASHSKYESYCHHLLSDLHTDNWAKDSLKTSQSRLFQPRSPRSLPMIRYVRSLIQTPSLQLLHQRSRIMPRTPTQKLVLSIHTPLRKGLIISIMVGQNTPLRLLPSIHLRPSQHQQLYHLTQRSI